MPVVVVVVVVVDADGETGGDTGNGGASHSTTPTTAANLPTRQVILGNVTNQQLQVVLPQVEAFIG